MSTNAAAGRCTVVVGCQWGDEGKGKIVDVLAESADIVARYQGGANAGHTVHVHGDEFILHQIPSGILHPGKRCLLGNGVVLDLPKFFAEYDALEERGIELEGRIGISQRAHLLLPYHRALDHAAEVRAREKIGTTGQGIGPAYVSKSGRRGVRVTDLGNSSRLELLVARAIGDAVEELEVGEFAATELEARVWAALALAGRTLPLATDTGREIVEALAAGRSVLMEGAQGTALDLDHGTYPFVTSSNTTAAAAATGLGVGPTAISAVLGVVKAYTTRVGNGPLPTEFDEEMGARVRELGGEFGATTGRPRRCGWFDAVQARYAARVNGLTGLAVTKLDVLDSLEEIRIATAYRVDGDLTTEFPADTWSLSRVEPVLERHPGWRTPTTEARHIADLPPEARSYLDRLQELTGVPIEIVSVGSRREQIIHV
ncbi:MAG: adenylosuccinate synthase [Gemmatimonadales bacterium]|nr:adenylosuccinate synthase [Gemmatimonadales bacterium]